MCTKKKGKITSCTKIWDKTFLWENYKTKFISFGLEWNGILYFYENYTSIIQKKKKKNKCI